MSSTPEFTDAQLTAARAQAWHQAGEPLVTLEAARAWINRFGLVLFAPRAQALGAPAPSLIEATLGRALGEAQTAPSTAQADTARNLLARLVAEGSALPLNLLGGPGDVPDFVVSAAVFSFCYTLRGDKAWKQPPSTAAAAKVSPLSLRVFEALTEHGSMTAHALASELGREVTDSAITRALGELWAQLRVFPQPAPDGGAVWELSTARFTKAIKAGSNAGLPTALSALVTVYLGQAIAASEEEVQGFLSPLTARSRIREVLHGLNAAQQLESVVLGGKALLYVPGELPLFAPEPTLEAPAEEHSAAGDEMAAARDGSDSGQAAEQGRISRFRSAAAPRGGDLRGKPVRPTAAARREGAGGPKRAGAGAARGARPASGTGFGKGFARGSAGKSEGRSFGARKPAGERFTRPWDEGKSSSAAGEPPKREFRPAAAARSRPDADGARPKRPYIRKDGDAPRPFRPRSEERAGSEERSAGTRGPARSFDSPRSSGASRSSGTSRSFGSSSSSRPARPFAPREFGSEARPFRPREQGSAERPARPFRRDGDAARPGFKTAARGVRPPFAKRTEAGADRAGSSDRPDRATRPARPFAGDAQERPFRPRRADSGHAPGATGEGRAGRSEGTRAPERSNWRPSERRPGREDASGGTGRGRESDERSARPKASAYAKPGFGPRPARPGGARTSFTGVGADRRGGEGRGPVGRSAGDRGAGNRSSADRSSADRSSADRSSADRGPSRGGFSGGGKGSGRSDRGEPRSGGPGRAASAGEGRSGFKSGGFKIGGFKPSGSKAGGNRPSRPGAGGPQRESRSSSRPASRPASRPRRPSERGSEA